LHQLQAAARQIFELDFTWIGLWRSSNLPQPTYAVDFWTEGLRNGLVFVACEALDDNLHNLQATHEHREPALDTTCSLDSSIPLTCLMYILPSYCQAG
jgi:hypothetical protein